MGVINDCISKLKIINQDVFPNVISLVQTLEDGFGIFEKTMQNLLDYFKEIERQKALLPVVLPKIKNLNISLENVLTKQIDFFQDAINFFKQTNQNIYDLTSTLMNGFNNLSEEETSFANQNNVSQDLMLEKKQLTITNGVLSFAIESKNTIEQLGVCVKKLAGDNQKICEDFKSLCTNLQLENVFQNVFSLLEDHSTSKKSLLEDLDYHFRLADNILNFANQLKQYSE